MGSTANPGYVHQNLTWHMFIYYYQRQIDLKWSQGDQEALRQPQRHHQAQPWLVRKYKLSSSKIDMVPG